MAAEGGVLLGLLGALLAPIGVALRDLVNVVAARLIRRVALVEAEQVARLRAAGRVGIELLGQVGDLGEALEELLDCLLYTSPSPRD